MPALAHAELTAVVTADDTAARFGEHFPPAASTPFVLGLAEVACHDAVAAQLDPGLVTVGTRAEVDHLAPSPVGATLTAQATLSRRDGRRLEFVVDVRDGEQVVARLVHHRAIVDAERILARLEGR